jgi:hypothetical protein
MIDVTENLKHARTALLAFEPGKAEDFLRKFESDLQKYRLPTEIAKRCSDELAAIRDLANAAREGVAAAQHQFLEVLKLSRQLDTYDRSGKRMAEKTAPRSTRKF